MFTLSFYSVVFARNHHPTELASLQVATAQLSSKRDKLPHWISTKKNPSSFSSVQYSNAIWYRVRQHCRIALPTPASTPLFAFHIKGYAKDQPYINKLVKNATPYFYYVLEEVEKRGMPAEIALLPMIESDFNPHTISHKGAAGIWQLMPPLGRLYGLQQSTWYDGRKDIYESTKVALDHLAYLHKRFDGNWLLALAAYNSGETRVLTAMKKNKMAKKPTDFWSLKLPKETMHFVPKLLALVAIVKSPKEYGVTLPNIDNKPVFERISTGKAIDIALAAKLINTPESHLHTLNPGFHKKTMHTSAPFHLVVPIQHAQQFKTQMHPPVQYAKKNMANTPQNTLKLASKTPSSQSQATPKKTPSSLKKRTHIVRSGESLPTISKKYNVKISTLLAYNPHLKENMMLHPGQPIVVSRT